MTDSATPRIGTVYLTGRCVKCGEELAATPWGNGRHSAWYHAATELAECGSTGTQQAELFPAQSGEAIRE